MTKKNRDYSPNFFRDNLDISPGVVLCSNCIIVKPAKAQIIVGGSLHYYITASVLLVALCFVGQQGQQNESWVNLLLNNIWVLTANEPLQGLNRAEPSCSHLYKQTEPKGKRPFCFGTCLQSFQSVGRKFCFSILCFSSAVQPAELKVLATVLKALFKCI